MCTYTNKEEIFFEYDNDTDQTYNDTYWQSLLTTTNISELQKKSEELKDLINYIAHRELPDDDKTTRCIIFESEQYIIENDTLFHLYQPRIKHMDKNNKLIKQLVISKQCRIELLHAHHDQNGHIGIARL